MDGVGTSEPRNRWTATVTITVHDPSENPIAGATVNGSWSAGANGGDACVTNGSGQCSVVKNNIKANASSVTFTVTDIASADTSYNASDNHDPDGDSDGAAITVLQP